jgi:hypothetical protein
MINGVHGRNDFSIYCAVCFVQQESARRTHGWEADIRISPQDIGPKIPSKRFDSPNAAG